MCLQGINSIKLLTVRFGHEWNIVCIQAEENYFLLIFGTSLIQCQWVMHTHILREKFMKSNCITAFAMQSNKKRVHLFKPLAFPLLLFNRRSLKLLRFIIFILRRINPSKPVIVLWAVILFVNMKISAVERLEFAWANANRRVKLNLKPWLL